MRIVYDFSNQVKASTRSASGLAALTHALTAMPTYGLPGTYSPGKRPHAAAMGQDLRASASLIAAATRNALLRAEERGMRSISFPSIGTGVGGFPLDTCAQIMIGEAVERLREGGPLELVRFVLWRDDAYRAFADELARQECGAVGDGE